MSDHSFAALIDHIVVRSVSDNWAIAKTEWVFSGALYHPSYTHCPCGVLIKEQVFIHNVHNDKNTYIGNVCIGNFLTVDNKLFAGIKRIHKDPNKNVNPALAEYAYANRIINRWEYTFLMNTCRKRKLSIRQMNTKTELNSRILKRVIT